MKTEAAPRPVLPATGDERSGGGECAVATETSGRVEASGVRWWGSLGLGGRGAAVFFIEGHGGDENKRRRRRPRKGGGLA